MGQVEISRVIKMADNDSISFQGAELKGGEKTPLPHWKDFYQEIGHKGGVAGSAKGNGIEPGKK
jgi:general stress protein YciG